MLPSGGEIFSETGDGSAFTAGAEGFFSTGATEAIRVPTGLNPRQRSVQQAITNRALNNTVIEFTAVMSQQISYGQDKQRKLPAAAATFSTGGEGFFSSGGETLEHKIPKVKTNDTKNMEEATQ